MIKKLLAFVTAMVALTSQTANTIEIPVEYAPAGVNPHKGWTLYTYSHWDYVSKEYGTENSIAWDNCDLIYTRVAWDSVQDENGTYDWSCIDEHIEMCRKLGKNLAFGVIPSNSLENNVNGRVPEFVYEDGCDSVMAKTECGYQRTPKWNDKTYLKHAKALADAIAERYDGDPIIEYIDIRTFGNWGEWHTYGLDGSNMPSDKVQMDMLRHWADAFEHTQLVVPVNGDSPTAVSEYAVSLGITLRRDGLVQLVGHENALRPAVQASLPVVGEFCSGYAQMKDLGIWDKEHLRQIIQTAELTYLQMGNGASEGKLMYAEEAEFMAEINEMLGYCFSVTEASLTRSDDISTLTVTIENLGVAPQHFPLYLKAGVYTDGRMSPTGEAVLIPASEFDGGTSRTYSFTIPSSDLGSTLYLGAFEEGCAEPTVSFANKGMNDQHWLELTITQ